jgi:hypothetical protein
VFDQLQRTKAIGQVRSAVYKSVKERSATGENKKLVLEVYLETLKN